MRYLITAIGLLGLLSPAFADTPGAEAPGSSLVSSLSGFQLGGWGDDSGVGDFGDVGGRICVSGFFSLIFPKSEQSWDIDGTGFRPPDWPYYYANGIGGSARLSYLLAPALRVGGGVGYEFFQAKKLTDEYTFAGTDYVDTYEMGSLNMLRAGVHVDFMFPLKLDPGSWFSFGKGFVEGVVPYIGWEGATTYRLRAINEDFNDWSDTTTEDEVMRPYFTFVNGLHAGVEIRMKGFGFFAEVGYLWYSPPKKGKDMFWTFRWDWMVAAPIRGGVVYYF